MALKKSSIVVNDVLEELSEENNRLLNELLFANKCLKVLSQFKTFIDLISKKLIQSLDKNQCKIYHSLNENVSQVMNEMKNNFKSIETNEEFGDNLETNNENYENQGLDSKEDFIGLWDHSLDITL